MNDSAQAQNLAGLVEYQKGSVVSKTLVQGMAGTVTIFAFDGGQGLSEHTAPFDAMVVVLDGEVSITIAGSPHLLKAGEMIIMPARKAHSLKAVSGFKMLLIMIKNEVQA